MVKVTQPACGVPGLSPGNLIPEAQLIPQSYTVAQFSLLFLFLHILSYDAENCSCQNLGVVISLLMIPMEVLQLAPKPRPHPPTHWRLFPPLFPLPSSQSLPGQLRLPSQHAGSAILQPGTDAYSSCTVVFCGWSAPLPPHTSPRAGMVW